MTFKVDDRVYETSTTSGTGDLTLAGAVTGFQAFSAFASAGDTFPYFLTDDTNWEVGIGTYATGPARLQRTTVLASSNSDAAVSWGGGTIKCRCGLPALMAYPRSLSKSIAGGAATTVLTQSEQRRQVIILTGAMTGNQIVEVDATVWDWVVYNNTSGAFTVTFRVTGQTGILLPQGSRTLVHCDGTDVRFSSMPTPASGGGIMFPATQVASSDANTLDDYEEGTFTPSIGGSATYTNQVGKYTKIGRLVTVDINLVINALGTGSTTTVSGLPFAAGSSPDANGAMGRFASIAVAQIAVVPQVGAGSSSITFMCQAASATSNTTNAAIIGSSADMRFSATYQT